MQATCAASDDSLRDILVMYGSCLAAPEQYFRGGGRSRFGALVAFAFHSLLLEANVKACARFLLGHKVAKDDWVARAV